MQQGIPAREFASGAMPQTFFMKTIAPRPVKIESDKKTWFVLYADRTKGRWTFAAQFARDMQLDDGSIVERTREWVEKWISERPKFTLVSS